jgi:hypothetical protein
MLNLGPVWNPGKPTQSLYVERLLVQLEDALGIRLLQRLDWHWQAARPAGLVRHPARARQVVRRADPVAESLSSSEPTPTTATAHTLHPLGAPRDRAARRRGLPTCIGLPLRAGSFRDRGGAIPSSLIVAAPPPHDASRRAERALGEPPAPRRCPTRSRSSASGSPHGPVTWSTTRSPAKARRRWRRSGWVAASSTNAHAAAIRRRTRVEAALRAVRNRTNPAPLIRIHDDEQEAYRRVTEILDKVAIRSHVPPTNARVVLRGGKLRAEAHPELATHFRPVWHPEADDLRPLGLDHFTVEAAARQIERYGRAMYVPVRRKLEAFLDALLGDHEVARESHSQPDSLLFSAGALSVSEIRRDGREPEYRIEFSLDDAPHDVAPAKNSPGRCGPT